MNKTPMFNFEGKDIRVIMIDETPWFVAPDAIKGLGLNRDTHAMCRVLDADERRIFDNRQCPRNSGGQYASSLTLISESGLYKLIMRAHPNTNPTAKRFQDWVTREVLPALRKDGMYVMGEEKVRTGARARSSALVCCGNAATYSRSVYRLNGVTLDEKST